MSYSIVGNACYQCHQCVDRCPARAICDEGEAFRIEPEKCIECGLCGRVCHFGAILDPAGCSTEPADIPAHEPEELETDLVIIGAGAAGIMTAVRAAELSGCRVTVLERTKHLGGCGWYGGAFRTFGSRIEQKHGVADRRPKTIDRVVKETCWKLDPALIGKTYYKLSEFVDWICERCPEMEKDFAKFPPREPGEDPDVILQTLNNVRSGGYYVLNVLLDLAKQYDIRFLPQRRATEILRGGDGKVSTVIAQDPGGIVTIRCKACMLAAGNWIADRDICEEVVPEFNHNRPAVNSAHMYPGCTGDGIGLAEKAGGYVDRKLFAARLFGPHIQKAAGGADFFGSRFETISVNLHGKRWVNEKKNELEASSLLMRQPGCCAYAIFDAGIARKIYENWQNGIGNEADGGPFVKPPTPDYLERLDAGLRENLLPHKTADTLEELAELTGLPADSLKETVERYNRFCAVGTDFDFFKPAEFLVPFTGGPYYAVYGGAVSDGGFGGVMIDSALQALDTEKRPIPGLYAGGDNCCGWFINLFGDKMSFINDLSWAFTSGYMAGESIADYLKNE